MSPDPRKLVDMILGAVMAPTARDGQLKIGPSSLGDPCDFCVGREMSRMLPGGSPSTDSGNLATWIGTAIHEKIERTTVGLQWDRIGWQPEMKRLLCGHVEGYGDVHGTTDGYSEEFATLVDYKGSTKAKIKKYRYSGGIPEVYNYQRHLYGLGVLNAGMPMRWVANIFFPRDAWRWQDVWVDIVPFDPDAGKAAIQRAQTIWDDFVRPGRITELGSDDDCFTCMVAPFLSTDVEVLFNGKQG
jgi:hypothetical protein